jgi:hypothetical protein
MTTDQTIWTTKDGQRIRICDMTDSHLTNVIDYLEKMIQHIKDDLKSLEENNLNLKTLPDMYDQLWAEKEKRKTARKNVI